MKTSSVLVLMDFSPKSFEALASALSLAKILGKKVTVLHIVESSFFTGKPDVEKIRNTLLATLLQAHPDFPKEDFFCVTGSFTKSLETHMKEHDVALVVLGQNGERWGIETFFLGSFIKPVIRTAKTPTLVLKTYQTTPYKHIMIPSDLSPESKEHIAQMALLFPETPLSVVYMYGEPSKKSLGIYGVTDVQIDTFLHAKEEEEGEKSSRFFKEISSLGSHIQPHVFHQSPTPEALIETASALGADLVALHTTGNFSFLAYDTLEASKQDILVSQK